MLSTESLLLPSPVNRASLRAFGLWFSVGSGVVIALLAQALGSMQAPDTIVVGSAVGMAIWALIIARPSIMWFPYRGWNWGVRQFVGRSINAVTWVAFHAVVRPLGKSVKPQVFERSVASSSWKTRATQSPDTYPSAHYGRAGVDEDIWTGLSEWRRNSSRRESILLVPFIALIRLLDVDDSPADSAPSDIYTLY